MHRLPSFASTDSTIFNSNTYEWILLKIRFLGHTYRSHSHSIPQASSTSTHNLIFQKQFHYLKSKCIIFQGSEVFCWRSSWQFSDFHFGVTNWNEVDAAIVVTKIFKCIRQNIAACYLEMERTTFRKSAIQHFDGKLASTTRSTRYFFLLNIWKLNYYFDSNNCVQVIETQDYL